MDPGSLSGFIVPTESRRTDPWEPGSREGNRLVVAATGRRGQDSEPVALVYGTAAGGDGRLPTIGGTVCRKSARTDLWGCRRVTTGPTRKPRDKSRAPGQFVVAALNKYPHPRSVSRTIRGGIKIRPPKALNEPSLTAAIRLWALSLRGNRKKKRAIISQ